MWGNERSLRKLWIRNVLSFLGTKTRKHINTWRNRTLPKTCILSVFHIFLISKHQNAWKATYMGKRNDNTRTIFFIVYERVIHQKKKKHGKNLIHENKTTLRKTCLLSDFEIVT